MFIVLRVSSRLSLALFSGRPFQEQGVGPLGHRQKLSVPTAQQGGPVVQTLGIEGQGTV